MYKLADYLQAKQCVSDADEVLLIAQNLLLGFAENQSFLTVQKILGNVTQSEYENTLLPILEESVNQQQHIMFQQNQNNVEPQNLQMLILSNNMIPYQQEFGGIIPAGKIYNRTNRWMIQHLTDLKILKQQKEHQADQYINHVQNIEYKSQINNSNEEIQISVQDLNLKTPINPFFQEISDIKPIINELNQIQKDIYLQYQQGGQNIIVSSPTGTGKTVSAILFYALNYKQNQQAAFVAPTHALCKQFYEDFQKYFPPNSGISCSIISDKIQSSVVSDTQYDLLKNNMIICTYEKLDVILNNLKIDHDFKLSCLLIDEIHNIYDNERGANLESLILKAKLLYPSCVFFGASGTLTNKNNLQHFLNAKLLIYGDEVRPVPITTQYYLFHNKSSYVNRSHMQQQLIKLLITELSDQQIIIFVQSQKQSQELAEMIANIPQLQKQNQNIQQHQIKDELLRQLMQKRVAYHHSAVDSQSKHIIENLFKQKELNIIVSTQTLAQGVNLPAKNVIIYGNMVYDNTLYQYRCLTSNEIQQMAGRAGRRGLDEQGFVYCFIDVSYTQCYEKWQNNEFLQQYVEQLENPIQKRSQLSRNLLKLINDIIFILHRQNNQNVSISEIEKILCESLYYFDVLECGTNYDFHYIIKQSVELLVRLNASYLCNDQLQLTELGQLAKKYYMQPQEASVFQFYIQLLCQQSKIPINKSESMNIINNHQVGQINQQLETQQLCIDHKFQQNKHINIWLAVFNSFNCLFSKIKVNIIEMHQWRDNVTKFCALIDILTLFQPRLFDQQLNYDFLIRDLNYLSSQLDRIFPFMIEVLKLSNSTKLLQIIQKMNQRYQIWKIFQQTGSSLTFNDGIGHLEVLAAVNKIPFQKQLSYVQNSVFYQNEDYFIQNKIFPEDLQYVLTKYPTILQEQLSPDELYLLQDVPFAELEFIYIQPISNNELRIQFQLQTHNNSQMEQYNQYTLLAYINNRIIYYKQYKQQQTINIVFSQQIQFTDVELQIQVIYQSIGFPLTKIISLQQIAYIFKEQQWNIDRLVIDENSNLQQYSFFITDSPEPLVNAIEGKSLIIKEQMDLCLNHQSISEKYMQDQHSNIIVLLDQFIDDKNQLDSSVELFIILLKQLLKENSVSLNRIKFITTNKQINFGSICDYMEIPTNKQIEICYDNQPNQLQQRLFLESRFDVDLINIAEQIRTQGTIKLTELLQIIEDSFFFFRLIINPLYYNFETFSITSQKDVQIDIENVNQFINTIIEEIVDELGAEAFE